VESIPETQMARTILMSIVDSVESAQVPDVRPLAPMLMAYGRSLDHDGRWSLAIDVYETTLAYMPAKLDPSVVIDGQMRLAHCLRTLGKLDQAEAAYREAKRIAASVDDPIKVLHARVGEGTLAVARGNLPLAESIFDEAIEATAAAGFDDIRSIALHGRAFVANARGDSEAGVRFAFEALCLTHNLMSRDRILSDIALAFTQIGMLDTARDGFLVVAATAQEQFVRWLAMVNLIEIAALQPNQPLFDRYRRALSDEPLPPSLRVHYHLYSAMGHQVFGQLPAAEKNLSQARALAEEHGYNQLAFQIDSLATKVRQGIATERRAPRETETTVRDIAIAVTEMRELAGV
jgi:tetratricopeptide (TPR) repeat protein